MPIVTLNDTKESNDDDERQAYYAGGQGQNGGGSGQEILDPRDFMKRARDEMGAQREDEWKAEQPSGPQAFTGGGQTLSGQSHEGAPAPQQPQTHTITFWQNGFSVDDGPLRTADDPANAAFLEAVNAGRMPAELGDADTDVHLVDKSGEPYKAPPPTRKPFSGEGRSMRDDAGGSSSGAAAAPVGDAAELCVDESQPTTTLQVRADPGATRIHAAQFRFTPRSRTAADPPRRRLAQGGEGEQEPHRAAAARARRDAHAGRRVHAQGGLPAQGAHRDGEDFGGRRPPRRGDRTVEGELSGRWPRLAARPRAAVLYGLVRDLRGREVGEKDFTRSPKRQRRLGHGRRRRDRAGGGRRSGGSISKGLGEGGVDVRLEGSEERLVCARGESGILAQRGLQQPEEGARRLGDDGVVAPQELDDERVLGAMRRELAAELAPARVDAVSAGEQRALGQREQRRRARRRQPVDVALLDERVRVRRARRHVCLGGD